MALTNQQRDQRDHQKIQKAMASLANRIAQIRETNGDILDHLDDDFLAGIERQILSRFHLRSDAEKLAELRQELAK